MLQQEVDSALSLKQITTNYMSTRHTSELPTEFDPLLTSSSSYQSKVLKSVGGTSIKTHRLVTPSSYFQHTTSSTIQLLATTPSMPTDAKLLSTIDSPLQTEMPAKASSIFRNFKSTLIILPVVILWDSKSPVFVVFRNSKSSIVVIFRDSK
jgi:hypothetical protein